MYLMRICLTLAVSGLACLATGCEKKERVVDIKTPGVEVEVNKTRNGIEVETERKRGHDVGIEVPGADVEIKRR
jgi:hypothetical protein